jgi:hypothetical protein
MDLQLADSRHQIQPRTHRSLCIVLVGLRMPRHRDIAVGLERAALVLGGKLDADILALGIVERGEHEGLSELAVVDEILRFLVISIDACFQSGEHLLHDANVVQSARSARTGLSKFTLGCSVVFWTRDRLVGAASTCSGGVKVRA